MENRRFIIIMASLTGICCVFIIIFNALSSPPYAAAAGKLQLIEVAPARSSAAMLTGTAGSSETASSSKSAVSNAQADSSSGSEAGSSSSVIYPININTATKEELEELPGIGEAKALNIIEYREANGPFNNIDELDNVSGIGKATMEKIRKYVTVS